MKSYKFKSSSQRSLRSFLKKKEGYVMRNQKQFFILSILKKDIKFFLLHLKSFFILIKKNYLGQLISFYEIKNFVLINSFLNLVRNISYNLRQIKNSRNNILLFFNIPFILSKILLEIIESIKKKTIYLYNFVFLLSMPIILFYVNNNFVIKEKKDFFFVLKPEKRNLFFNVSKIYEEKNSIFLKYLKKEIFYNQIILLLSKKVKKYPLKSSYILNIDSLVTNLIFHYQDSFKNGKLLKNKIKQHNQKSVNLFFTGFWSFFENPVSKSLCIYLNVKKNYLSNFYNDFFKSIKTSKNLWILKYNYLKICKLLQLCKKIFLRFKNNYYTNNFNLKLKIKIFQRIDSLYFSLITPLNLKLLNKTNLKILSNKRSFVLDFLESSFLYSNSWLIEFLEKEGSLTVTLYNKQKKILNTVSLYLKDCINCSKQKKIQENLNLLQSSNKQNWIIPINQWIDFYTPKNYFNFLLDKKQQIKEHIKKFNNLNFVIFNYKKFLQKFCVKPILNSTNLSFIIIKNKQKTKFKSYRASLIVVNFNKFLQFDQKDYWYTSYTKNKENSLISLKNKEINITDFSSFFLKRNDKKFIFLNTNFVYNLSLLCPNKNILLNFKNLLLNKNREKINDLNLYDLHFYLINNKSKDDLFWISNLSLSFKSFNQKTVIKQKNQNQKKSQFSLLKRKEFTSFQEELNLIQKKRFFIKNNIFSNKSDLFEKYNKWFFTTHWWFFYKKIVNIDFQSFLEQFNNQKYIFLYNLSTKFNDINKKYQISILLNNISHNIVFPIHEWTIFLNRKIYFSSQEKPFWINLKFFSSIHNNFWNLFSWFITSSIIYYHWLSMLIGVIYLYFWLDFEKIRSLSCPSWKTIINIIAYNSDDSLSHQLILTEYSSRGKILSISSFIYTKFLKHFFIFDRLYYTTTVDLSKKNKNLVSSSLITPKTLQSKYNFWNINKHNQKKMINGFNFFQKWCEKNYRISGFLQKNTSKSYSLNWLTDLFFYNRFMIVNFSNISHRIPYADNLFERTKHHIVIRNNKSKPVSLLEPVKCITRWLFIGSSESDKSFVIKNIATKTYYPLIYISIKDLKTKTPDIKYNAVKKQKRWIEQLSERSFFLENILNLAKILAPSMLWISDLHNFYIKDQLQEKTTNKFNISLLMATLLKILTIDLVPDSQNHIVFVGSTDNPKLLDPKFMSRHRLDLIVNFRNPSIDQRQSIFTFLLKNKGFFIKSLHSFYEFNSNTIGYTFQDVTSLVNETLLIKTLENNNIIDNNTIKLAFYRKTAIQSVKYFTKSQENLQYKIGKALVQTILVYPKSLLLLSKYHDLWKNKFYFLSNSYLEISNKKIINTEISMLSHILNYLAGSAARDAWLLTSIQNQSIEALWIKRKKDLEKITFALTNQLKHDFCIASNIFQSLLIEFPIKDINKTLITFKEKNNTLEVFLTNCFKKIHFKFLKKEITYLEFFDQFPNYIDWSIKIKRLSFSWLLLFNGIRYSTKNTLKIGNNNQGISSLLLEKEIDIHFPYERREIKQQQQKIAKIESLFNKMLYTHYIQNLGFPWESEYVMSQSALTSSLFFVEARPFWNPQLLLPVYSILFFDRDLLINQNLLTNLYITYGNKFQNEKLNRKRIKKQFFWSNFTLNKLNLNKNMTHFWDAQETKNDFIDYRIQDFYFYQNLINLNAQLDQSQIQFPVYLHQGWITPDQNEIFRTFDFLYTQILENNKDLIKKESLLFKNLLEIYNYLLKFFIKNNNIMIQLKHLFIKNNILYRQDIERYMKKNYNI